MHSWIFKDSPNTAVITTKKIIHGDAWIGFVTHDLEDGSWQFHENHLKQPSEKDAAVVGLKDILQLDPSVAELATLPLGWKAHRTSKNGKWNCERQA